MLAEQEGDFDADSCWAVAWFEQHGFDQDDYGDAETLSKAKNTSVAGMVHAGLCYRLYTLCERKKRAADALSYNSLVQSWPEIARISRASAADDAGSGDLLDALDAEA